ncbi:MAG: sigma-70 family RNA polymerase sigma factor [Bacteroidales bacterium]|nr:sigma-70 family RNA polymerase sigma factor [Bacteroidales bacterium]
MKLKIRFNKYYQTLELNEKEIEQLWISLDIESNPSSREEKEKLIQEKFEEIFNKPELNNWRKVFRRYTMPKKPFRKDDQEEDLTDHMDYIPDYTDLENQDRKADYEFYCKLLRKNLTNKQAEAFIAVYLDGVPANEYADSVGTSKSNISHHLAAAKKKLKKIFPNTSTFPSSLGL